MNPAISEPQRPASGICDPLSHCPACGSARLDPVVIDGDVSFCCRDCRGAWQVELGHARPVRLPERNPTEH